MPKVGRRLLSKTVSPRFSFFPLAPERDDPANSVKGESYDHGDKQKSLADLERI
jgi:hypothetical protein